MAGRIRSIKPEILEDEKPGAMSNGAWRLWVSMWLLADDHGRLRGSPIWLKGQVFWHDKHVEQDVAALLDELTAAGVIRPYEVDGQKYVEIKSWKKHQKIDHPGKPRIPQPSDTFENSSRDSRETLDDPRETLAPDLRSGSPISDQDPDHERSVLLAEWRRITGNLISNPPDMVAMMDLITRAAAEEGCDPAEYIVAFVEWQKSCPPGRRPQLAPDRLTRNFAAVQEWRRGDRKPESALKPNRPEFFSGNKFQDGE